MKKTVWFAVVLMGMLVLTACTEKTGQPDGTENTTTPTAATTPSAPSAATDPTTAPTTAPTASPTAVPTAEPTTVRDNKYVVFLYKEGTNHSDYDNGYEGARFTTDGMKVGGIYAVNDGQICVITEQNVSLWETAIVRESVTYVSHTFYVLRDDPTKVWMSNRDGTEQRVVYTSQYGEVTYLYHHSDSAGILYIAEKENRIIALDMQTGKFEVMFEAHKIEQFSYQPSENRIFWSGYLNASDPVNPYSGNAYYYYIDTGKCWVLVNNKEWMLATRKE